MSGHLSGFGGYEVYQHVVTHDFHLVTPRFNCRKYKTDYAVIAAAGEVQPHGEDMRPAARIQNWWVAYPYAKSTEHRVAARLPWKVPRLICWRRPVNREL